MAWNQPGDNKPRDPWGRGGDGKQQPPELDKIFKDIKKQLTSLLGGKASGGKPSGTPSKTSWSSSRLLTVLVLGLFAVFLFAGFYQVSSNQRAVLLQGKTHTVVGAGLHWRNPLLERVVMVPMDTGSHYRLAGEFASSDGDILTVGVEVGYRVTDPAAYALAVAEPLTLLQNLTLAAVRRQVAQGKLTNLLGVDQAQLAAAVQQQLAQALASWHCGLEITQVSLTKVALPDEVKDAYAAYSKATSDAKVALQGAETDKQAQVLAAQGKTQLLLTEASAYQQKAVDQAEGETSRFNSLLVAYQKAPKVTRERLYFDTMEAVLSHTSKILLTGKNGQLSLSLDALLKANGVDQTKPTATPDQPARTDDKSPAQATTLPSLYDSKPTNGGDVP